MTTLLAPARLPLSTVEEGLDGEDNLYWRKDLIALRHGYLRHSLTLVTEGWDTRRSAAPEEKLFGLSSPQNIAAPGRGFRTLSDSYLVGKKMAAVTEATALSMEDPETAPSSPPELSYSKSSKSSSSSIRSDTSDDEEPATKLSNFEDISIADAPRDSLDDSNLRPESRPTLKRPIPRSMTAGDGGRTMTSPPMGSPENRFPTLNVAVSGTSRDPVFRPMPNGLPNGLGIGMRRGFTSPSLPSLYLSTQRTSRSPSPTKPFMQNGISVSPQTLASATPRLCAEQRSPNSAAFSRRKSWQPGQRKTAKEIEAEYNDEDEDVPDEAILENVPISPMPGQPRLSQSLSRPNSRSTTPSPQRRPSHTNLHSANVPKMAKRPSAPTILPNGQYGAPRSPRHSRPHPLQHSNTMPVLPPGQLQRKHRSKSWTDDLNEEAKQLSAALELHAERDSLEKTVSGTNSVSSSPPEPSFLKERAKSVANLELPPIQRGNIMIDPLPISKEKEAVLTRTRPSWLPPKSQKEERRHLKEWEQMMARAAENDKKRALKERELKETKDEMQDSIARIWDQHVLPNWELVVKEPRTRELWWRGVTPRSRGVVWQRAIGNELELSESSFDAALRRANEMEEKVAEMTSEEHARSKEAAWFDAISRDVPNACPELTATEKRAPFQNALRDVLKAYAMYRSDVGYVYGTHLIAGVLCLHLRPSDAFVALANMLNRPVPLAFLVHDTSAMARTYDMVLSTLNYKFSKLHGHLTSPAIGLKPEEYLDPIFRCLFAYHLPSEHVSRIWDIFMFEGDKVLIRAAVAVLGKLEGKLYGSRDEILDLISWRNEKNWDLGPEEDFIMAVREAGKVDPKGETKSP